MWAPYSESSVDTDRKDLMKVAIGLDHLGKYPSQPLAEKARANNLSVPLQQFISTPSFLVISRNPINPWSFLHLSTLRDQFGHTILIYY